MGEAAQPTGKGNETWLVCVNSGRMKMQATRQVRTTKLNAWKATESQKVDALAPPLQVAPVCLKSY
eukprot:6021552-Amphidinium_carterae.1